MRKQTLLFWLAVLVQVLIVAAVPARKIYTRLTGTTIMIKTAPVDPYDFLSGYHVVLNYEISSTEGVSHGRGKRTVYAILEEGPSGIWSRTQVVDQPPEDLADDQLFIKGQFSGSRIYYGIEHYYIPEEQRGQIDEALRANPETAFARVRVDRFGNAALVGLTIDGKDYDY